MSFITTVEKDLGVVESAVVSGLKTAANYVEGVIVTDIAPELGAALLKAVETLGSELLTELLGKLGFGATVTVPSAPAN